jgi:poly(hydroxyalkanoate) depolymerase family esterase
MDWRTSGRAMRLLASLALSVSFSYRVEAAGTEQVDRFGRNPGKLLMFKYVPDGLAAGAPLVVALHGCNQSATDFDDESGWTEMAERLRFAVLLPGQQEANNPTRCFNFFLESDNRRGRGEAASIMAMIEAMRNQHRTDPDRTYVTGLSAGGAMTAVMLAGIRRPSVPAPSSPACLTAAPAPAATWRWNGRSRCWSRPTARPGGRRIGAESRRGAGSASRHSPGPPVNGASFWPRPAPSRSPGGRRSRCGMALRTAGYTRPTCAS